MFNVFWRSCLSFRSIQHRRSFWRQFRLIFLPLALSVLILFSLVSSVHFYRQAYISGSHFSPLTPKSQRSFSFNVARANLPADSGSELLLKITKEKNAFGSTRYWHSGSVVLSLPLQISTCGICIRLALWDPGVYRVTLSNHSGDLVFSSLLTVIAPLALYRDDIILILVTLWLSWASGRLAVSILGGERPFIPVDMQRKVQMGLIAAGLMALGLIFIPYPELHTHQASKTSIMSMGSDSPSGKEPSTLESEGRIDAVPIALSPPGTIMPPGYLTIRHHMDSWTEFGRTLTVFEGATASLGATGSFFLLPDDGRYFLSLWASTSSGKSLADTHWVLRSLPVSPPLPVALLSGLALFSLSGFFWGLLIRTPFYRHSGK